MTYSAFLKVSFIVLVASLVGCNRYKVESCYDEFKSASVCSLKDNLLKNDYTFFLGSLRLELNLEKGNDERVLAYFCLTGINKNSFFKTNTQMVFTLIDKENGIEKIKLNLIQVQNKSEKVAVYGYMGQITYNLQSTSIATATMTREQVMRIALAERATFAIETTFEPITGDLDQEDLQPIREFTEQCLRD